MTENREPKTESLPAGWKRRSDVLYVRQDGAIARYDDRFHTYRSSLRLERLWTAWSPDPDDHPIWQSRRGTLLRWARRFGSPLTAMRAADRQWPLR